MAIRSGLWIKNITLELDLVTKSKVILYNDNKKALDFVDGSASAKNTKYMELRMYAVQEYISKNQATVQYTPGEEILADALTKVVTIIRFKGFSKNILGIRLLDTRIDLINNPTIREICDGVCKRVYAGVSNE
jgi:hypothetical protein